MLLAFLVESSRSDVRLFDYLHTRFGALVLCDQSSPAGREADVEEVGAHGPLLCDVQQMTVAPVVAGSQCIHRVRRVSWILCDVEQNGVLTIVSVPRS